jgi:hypothetical protein
MLGAVPVVGNGHHHRFTQSLMQFLGSGLLQRYVIGVLQLSFCPLQDIQAIIIHGLNSPFLNMET